MVRVPASDLTEPSERERLDVLRGEGVDIVPFWLWTKRGDLAAEIVQHRELATRIEIVLPGSLLPSSTAVECIARLQSEDIQVTLSPALPGATSESHYHQRTRVGYRPEELHELALELQQYGARIERAACRMYPGESVWTFAESLRDLPDTSIGSVDCYLDFSSEDDTVNAYLVAEAMAAVATIPKCRLVLGPLIDLDRSMDVAHGLLDRLSNPRPAFQVARCLNSLLITSPSPVDFLGATLDAGTRVIALRQDNRRMSLVVNDPSRFDQVAKSGFGMLSQAPSGKLYDLATGLSAAIDSPRDFSDLTGLSGGPLLYIEH
jgi:hypothetical protein